MTKNFLSSVHVWLNIPYLLKRFWLYARILAFCFVVVSVTVVVFYKFAPVRVTPLMVSRSVEAFFSGNKQYVTYRQWVPIEKISPNLVRAVIASEDNTFTTHHGFCLGEIKTALKDSKNGKRLRGGSTISQQCAKNVFLPHSRSWIRKGLEAYFTVLIELIWGKERIMEVYLNVIEMGNGIYGAQAAAECFFHTSANKLTKQQSALIAACLPNPRRFHADRPSAYIQKRQQHIIKLMPKVKTLDNSN